MTCAAIWPHPKPTAESRASTMDSASPGRSTPDVGALLLLYTGCSQHTAVQDLRRICRLAEVCKAFLKQRAMDLIATAAGSPVLAHYSCDGTPLSTKVKLKGGSPQGFSATAEGRQTDEFLVQHCFYRSADALGRTSTTVLLRDPLPLTEGKTGVAVFAAGVQFAQTVRQHGHTGISVAHYAFDRALYSVLQKLFKQHYELLAPRFSAPAEGRTARRWRCWSGPWRPRVGSTTATTR